MAVSRRKGAASTAEAAAATSQTPAADKGPERRKATIPDTGAGYIGVTLTKEGAYGIGVRVEDLVATDLAAKAGIQVDDVIVALNGKDVSQPHKAIEFMEAANGEKLEIEYLKKPEAEKASKAAALARAARRRARVARFFGAIAWFLHKVLTLVVFLMGCAAILYDVLPQDYAKDPLDLFVLPFAGYAPPPIGYDGRPERRIYRSKDPSKPWMVEGWDEEKEKDMYERLEACPLWTTNIKDWAAEGNGDHFKAARAASIIDQIRATQGAALDGMEARQREAEYREMFWNEKIKERDERRAAKKAEKEKEAFMEKIKVDDAAEEEKK